MNNENLKENNIPNFIDNKRYPSFESIKQNNIYNIILDIKNKEYKGGDLNYWKHNEKDKKDKKDKK